MLLAFRRRNHDELLRFYFVGMFYFRQRFRSNASTDSFRYGIVVDFAVGHVALSQRRMFYDVFIGQFELEENKRVVYRVTFFGRFRSVLISPSARRG